MSEEKTAQTSEVKAEPTVTAKAAPKAAASQKPKAPTRLFVAYRPETESPPRAAGFGITLGEYQRETYRFNPGINPMAAADWDKIKGYGPIKERVERGILVVHSEDPEVSSDVPSEISGLKEAIALAVVEESRDEAQLKRWLEREQGKRARVVQAITRQIAALKRGVI